MIILVDDDSIQNHLNERILQIAGILSEIKIFEDAEAALSFIQNTEEVINLVLLDLNMPGMNGWDFLDQYEPTHPIFPVCILTSSISRNDFEKSEEYNSVSRFISKPLTVDMAKKLKEEFQIK
jgi:DNA-binding NtrC family response regulator